MSLKKCKECNAEVSDKAMNCPTCGAILRKPKRSFFGKIIKFLFIGFNILMLIWIIGGVSGAEETINATNDELEKAGMAVGAGIGVTFLLIIWAAGSFVLGIMTLLTRPKN